MCGICGTAFLRSGRPASPTRLEAMCASMSHRGPDETGLHVEGSVGLGVARLKVIDLHTGSQPIFNEDRSVCAVLNGEIYNYRELRSSLEGAGHHFRTKSDTEVIVHLYEEHGADFVEHLNGMFAIGLWDAVERRLVIVRDRLGEKPLYYAWTDDGIVFASELGCMAASAAVPFELDHEAVLHYFTLGYIPHPWSIYRDIRHLPPGMRLIANGEDLRIDRYWAIPRAIAGDRSEQAVREELEATLADAVRLRLVADVPLGAFLSGGLDSSVIVALMARASPASLKTFHIDFDDPDACERDYARAVARHYGTEHHEFVVRPDAADVLDELVAHFGEPFGDASAIPTYFVSKLTREHAVVALSGDGGDECFGGYRSYQRALARWRRPGFARAPLEALGSAIHRGLPRGAKGRRFFRSLGMDGRQHFAVGVAEMEARDLLSRELLDTIPDTSTYAATALSLGPEDERDPLSNHTFFDLTYYLPDDILTKVDRMSMAHSLEVRAPFLDHRVVELAASLPQRMKIRDNETKLIVKRTFAKDLPDVVVAQRKRGFEPPLARWLRHDLRPQLEAALHDPAVASSNIFRMEEIRAQAHEHLTGARDRADLLWRYLFFVSWWHQRACAPCGSVPTHTARDLVAPCRSTSPPV